jgi:hypothetical protein
MKWSGDPIEVLVKLAQDAGRPLDEGEIAVLCDAFDKAMPDQTDMIGGADTLWDRFAMAALAGTAVFSGQNPEKAAAEACRCADEMMKARK